MTNKRKRTPAQKARFALFLALIVWFAIIIIVMVLRG